MPVTVKLRDLVDAIEGAMDEHSQYVDRTTGEIVVLTHDEWSAADDDKSLSDYPEWLDENGIAYSRDDAIDVSGASN